jgi:hypothetical protein
MIKRFFLPLILLLIAPAMAQRVSLPAEGVSRPGQYGTLVVEANEPGLVSVRGDGMMGIDWPVPGRATVTAPLMSWRQTSGELKLTVNGEPVSLLPPPASPASTESAAIGPASAMFSEDAKIPTYAWSPGRPVETRRWIILASVAVTGLIALAGVLLLPKSTDEGIKPKRHQMVTRTMALLMISIGVTLLIPLAPALSRRDSVKTVGIRINGPSPRADVWVYRTAEVEQIVREPWSEGMWIVPSSPTDLAKLSPVLELDPAGRPQFIAASVGPGRFAVFLHRLPQPPEALADAVPSPALARRLYGPGVAVEGDWVVVTPE